MTRQRLGISGSDSDDSIASHARARPRAMGSNIIPSSLNLKTITLEDLLHWAFVREQVERARPEGVGAAPSRPAGYPSTDSSSRIGAAVGSSLNLGFEAPRDAYAVLRAVERCSARRAVRAFALTSRVPDWTPEPVVYWEQGEPIIGKDHRGRRLVVGYCVSLRGDLPEHVAERRRTYDAWARGMADVHGALSRPGVLAAHVLIGAPPQKSPWACC